MDLVAPESREEVGRRVAERSTEPYEHVALKKDGTRIAVEVRGQFFVEAERALRVTAIRDMTHRKRLEAELFAAAREWNECFDAMPVGLVIADRAGRIQRVNRQLLVWSGYPAFRDLMGRTLDGLSADEPWPTLMRLAQAGGRGAVAAEASNTRTRTAWRVAWSEFPRPAGEVPSTILVIRDVTEETLLRDELRRQETLAAMGSLVAGVAHEVRTPLFSISATLDAFSEGTPEELEEGSRLLRAQVKRLGNLMSDLLDYGKPPALQLEEGGIVDIVDRAVRACEGLAADAEVGVRVDRNGSMPVVRRDARRLEQAFQNLVANAIQHSPRGGTVHVVTEAGAGRVECRVEDEGVGIPEENLSRLFEPFFTRRKGGTGLGLPIVQRIVEAHGGRVAAANRLHRGAVFTVTLPVAADGTEVLRV
jgi:PAS domain S-box-containing protein